MLDLDQNGPINAQAEERTTLDAYLDSPSKDPPHSLPEIEVVEDPHQTDEHVQLGLRRSTGVQTSTRNTLYRDFVLN